MVSYTKQVYLALLLASSVNLGFFDNSAFEQNRIASEKVFKEYTGFSCPRPVSSEYELMARDVFKEIGLEKETKAAQIIHAKTGTVFIFQFLGIDYYVINQDYFKELPVHQQRALVAHTAMWHKHGLLSGKSEDLKVSQTMLTFCSFAFPIFAVCKIMYDNHSGNNHWYNRALYLVSAALAQALCLGLNARISRGFIHESDAKGVKSSGYGKELIEFMETLDDDQNADKTSVHKFFRKLFSSQPDWHDRIEHIKQVMQKQNAQQLAA